MSESPLYGSDDAFLRALTPLVCSGLDMDAMLERLGLFLQDFLPLSGMEILLTEPQTLELTLIAASHYGAGYVHKRKLLPITPEQYAVLEHELDFYHHDRSEVPRVYLVNDPDSHPLLQDIFRSILDTNVSYMRVPLNVGAGAYVSLHTTGKHMYTAEHVRLAGLLRDPLTIAVSNILEHERILNANSRLLSENQRLEADRRAPTQALIAGAGTGLAPLLRLVEQVAPSDVPVLILGETGVGKELIANAVHMRSQRADKPFIKVNCGAIPENLLDSELFGHERGAFTGASAAHQGWFERADKGTIFLDEIGELSLSAQVRLLRVLQSGEVERLGGTRVQHLNIRVLAATHRDLASMVRQGAFRQDLWFRLNVFPLYVPPLRERLADLEELVWHIASLKCREMGIKRPPTLDSASLAAMRAYDWPGNVRELENMVERSLILSRDKVRIVWDLHGSELHAAPFAPTITDSESRETLAHLEKKHIEAILQQTHGRVEGEKGAAIRLGLHPSTLRARMRKLGIRPFRGGAGIKEAV